MNYFQPFSLENFKLNFSSSFTVFFFNRHIAGIVTVVSQGVKDMMAGELAHFPHLEQLI